MSGDDNIKIHDIILSFTTFGVLLRILDQCKFVLNEMNELTTRR